jgi:hypothetical protein
MADKAEKECCSFEQVLSEELMEVASSRKSRLAGAAVLFENTDEGSPSVEKAGPSQRARDMKLAGLAFSGGGIRSATFNLGVLQGLARVGLLRRFDYLSTVSGGGYIGSWLSAWIKHVGSLATVDEELLCDRESGTVYREPDPVNFLRKYSNYLTPKLGVFSADTWALIAVYLRNLTLNLLIITAFFLAVFLVPRLAVWYAGALTSSANGPANFLFFRALWCLGIAVFFISLNQSYWSVKRRFLSDKVDYPWYARQGNVLLFVALPIMLSALFGGLWLWHGTTHQSHLNSRHAAFLLALVIIAWLTGTFAAYLHANVTRSEETTRGGKLKSAAKETLVMVGELLQESIRPRSRLKTVSFLFWAVLAVLAGCGLFGGLFALFKNWTDEQKWMETFIWYATAFGAPLVAGVYMATGTLLIGLMGRGMQDESREWWSRLGGWLIICSLIWTVLCAIAFFSLPLIAAATGYISAAWVVSTISGVILGKSPLTGGKGSKKWIEVAVMVVPYVFVVGLFMFLSFLTSSILIWTTKGWDTFWTVLWINKNSLDELMSANFLIMNDALDIRLVVMFIISLGAALALSWRVDINQFSIHLLYRNRLMRGYLGASNKNRQSQPFTGFDPNDDLPLSDLQTSVSYAGPYPIINTALNLVTGRQLAWQTRKAASFMFTPLHSGYQGDPAKEPDNNSCCYRPTIDCARPDGMSLGTAMAISGAAASPNMGYHSSPSLAFLMTVFNVRLGWWSGNPRYEKKWRKAGPAIGLWYMLKELFGLTDDESGFVYLSDGGHFENLGIYELVKRRCRFIVACDAGQDEDMKFDDLGNAVRKIRVDLGTDIMIDVGPLRDGKKHCALGKINYHTGDGREEYGDLIYIKASLCGKEPADVRNYKALHKEFPNQTTADQWFDEDQFESYRMVGLHTILELSKSLDVRDFETLVKKVEQYIEKV